MTCRVFYYTRSKQQTTNCSKSQQETKKTQAMPMLLQRVMVVCVISSSVMMMFMVSFSPDFTTTAPRCFTMIDGSFGSDHRQLENQNESSTTSLSSSLSSSLSVLSRNLEVHPPPIAPPPPLPLWLNASRPVYLHIHMAKTAGTEHNGILANRFERVCGHKGYSYDAFQTNERFQKSGAKDVRFHAIKDLYSTHFPTYSRHRVPPKHMDEIGYEDCDFISNELPWTYWGNRMPLKRYAAHNIPVEIHVPCRDPIEHLMSQCNYLQVQFQCNAANLSKEVDRCVMEMNRFSFKLLDQFAKLEQSIGLKSSYHCFNALPLEPYIDYMEERLQPKRFSSEYAHRSTNGKRNKDAECIWKQGEAFQEELKQLLRQRFEYYQFCDQCIGSTNDLFLSETKRLD